MPQIKTARLTMWYESHAASPAVEERAPIVLIAGFSMQGIHWPDELLEALTARGHRVIVFDNRDIGLTERCTGTRALSPIPLVVRRLAGRAMPVPYTLDAMADDTVALMDALAIDRAHIVGMSMGGMIAQLVALRHPSRVLSLCSWSSMTGAITELMISPRMIPAMLRSPSPDPQQRLKESEAFWVALGTRTYPMDPARIRALVLESAERAPDIRGIPRQFNAMLASPSRRERLKTLQVPTLIIHGTVDPLVPFRGGKAAARLIPGARFYAIDDYGHNLPESLMEDIAEQIVANAERAA